MEKFSYPNRCFTCAGCDADCPISLRTGALKPRSLVRLHVLGMTEALLRDPSIWYCIQCERCARTCPMNVKPSAVIRSARNKALSEGIVNPKFPEMLRQLRRRLQIARRQAAQDIFYRRIPVDPAQIWQEAETLQFRGNGLPVTVSTGTRLQSLKPHKRYMGNSTAVSSCWTCGSCSNACPVSENSDLFSPMFIIRTVNIGQDTLTARSGECWLCVACERCIDACPQGVKGAWVIRSVQDIALRNGEIPPQSYEIWRNVDSRLHSLFVDAVRAGLLSAGGND
ncbi:4Fe-4S dicluster domain-containing protein [Thermodesulforhabdus norvegica]|uniref:4Fe-4S dicluster domain-containing protein n=1 Tax=Thermodesulforhabdus norvegica TaxID=39841 RepID=A0A1I4VXC5_9BACT|nr:4Fe-4S dicluster domain-containing protein [Thermodesulforhabdus norvegica]SFN05656.1 4Fe-4S dicluster domain-containing protein [Thermodesulforhabdus norvegica]